MKPTRFSFRRFGVVAFCASFVFAAVSCTFAQETDSPVLFANKGIVIYVSPQKFADVPVVQKIWNSPETQAAVQLAFANLDPQIIAKLQEVSGGDASQLERLKSIVCQNAGTASFGYACVKSWLQYIGQYVDGIVLAMDLNYRPAIVLILNALPQQIESFDKDEKDVVEIFKANGKEIDAEFLKKNSQEFVGKLILKKDDDVQSEVYYGGAKVKDMDRFVVVLAHTQEDAEEVVAKFQNTNAFVKERQDDESLFADCRFGQEFWRKEINQLKSSPETQETLNTLKALGIEKSRSVHISSHATESVLRFSVDVAMSNAESAQTTVDYLNDFIVSNKENIEELRQRGNPSALEQFGLQFFQSLDISHEEGSLTNTYTFELDSSFMEQVLKTYIWKQISTVQSAKAQSRSMQCKDNLKQIMLAIHNYHDVNGRLPASYTVDADGRPLHSWRVYLLPYLDQVELYKQIRLNEPWDGEWNSQFHSQMPDVFHCPADDDAYEGTTRYALVVGEKTPFNKPSVVDENGEITKSGGYSLTYLTDGTSNTICVVEHKKKSCWMDPTGDFDIELLKNGFDQSRDDCLSSSHTDGVNVGMFDGAVRSITEATPLNVLKAMGTANGGEDVKI